MCTPLTSVCLGGCKNLNLQPLYVGCSGLGRLIFRINYDFISYATGCVYAELSRKIEVRSVQGSSSKTLSQGNAGPGSGFVFILFAPHLK